MVSEIEAVTRKLLSLLFFSEKMKANSIIQAPYGATPLVKPNPRSFDLIKLYDHRSKSSYFDTSLMEVVRGCVCCHSETKCEHNKCSCCNVYRDMLCVTVNEANNLCPERTPERN